MNEQSKTLERTKQSKGKQCTKCGVQNTDYMDAQCSI